MGSNRRPDDKGGEKEKKAEKKGGEEERRDSRINVTLSRALAYGVYVSAAIVFLGIILMLIEQATGYECSLSSLDCLLSSGGSVSAYPDSISTLAAGLFAAKPFAIIEFGVLALIATPVVRVLTSLVVFSVQRDRAFVIITFAVFVVLLFSFFVVPFISIFRA